MTKETKLVIEVLQVLAGAIALAILLIVAIP
jgi:hypothetical protein